MGIGERSAIAQIGDPDMESLLEALVAIEQGGARSVATDALEAASRTLPRPDLKSRVLLFPGDAESRVLSEQMNGALGFSLGAQVMMVFVWPVDGWREWLGYTVAHEYAHLVRNLLFPRGLSGGKFVYMKTSLPETLLDAMVIEGIADRFAQGVYPDAEPRWVDALDDDASHRMWRRVRRRLAVSDPQEIRRMLFRDNDRIVRWTGYTFGYRIVESYLEANPGLQPAQLVSVPASTMLAGSKFANDS